MIVKMIRHIQKRYDPASLEQPCNLYAWYKEELTSSDVAQILDESGQEHNFPSVQEAVQAAADGQRIYLLKDCDESVQIGKDKNVILDLNGYTLCSSQENVLDVRGKLEVDSTTANIHTNPDQGGRIQPAEGVAGNRGVFVREGGAFTLKGGVITGFSGVKYGGGIYADQEYFRYHQRGRDHRKPGCLWRRYSMLQYPFQHPVFLYHDWRKDLE